MKLGLKLLSLIILAGTALGQTFVQRSDTFTFDQTSVITSWDGSDPANPPYPDHMGSINLGSVQSSGIVVAFELGYLNGGYLQPCDPITFAPKQWIVGNGSHDGDTYKQTGSTNCPYFTGEYGTSGNSASTFDGFSVVAIYVHHIRPRTCQRYQHPPCTTISDTLTSGTGTVTQVVQ